MQNAIGVYQRTLNDDELIALLREAQEYIDACGDSNVLNVLLRDFARELLRRRLLAKVQLVQLMDLTRPN